MARPTSFRLPGALLDRLSDEAAARGMSVTALVATVLDEGLKTSPFPGIVYRDGPTGRRAGLAGGPDVWEIVRDLKHVQGPGEQRVQALAQQIGLPAQRIRLALAFYAAFPEEIEERIAADERAAARLRVLIDQRNRLLAT
ncbi:MAG: copG [Chloroflexi bacterium]|nr:copG [Chloroflexota bacterium]